MLPTEDLPFKIYIAKTEYEYLQAASVRAAAYARHDYFESYQPILREISEEDLKGTVLYAVSKETGKPVGTLRLGFHSQNCTWLPEVFKGAIHPDESYVYCDRFGVDPSISRFLTLALMKAFWFLAAEQNADYMLGAALKPLARRYSLVGLEVLDVPTFKIPYLHTDDYYAMGGRTSEVLQRGSPSLRPFFADVDHPDLGIPRPAALCQHTGHAPEYSFA